MNDFFPSGTCQTPMLKRHMVLPTIASPGSLPRLPGGRCLNVIESYASRLGRAHRSTFLFGSLAYRLFMFNISFSKPISSISGGTLRSTRQPKSFKVAPYIKTVSFHFQTSIYGIKCNIAKKTVLLISKKGTCCVNF